MKHPAAFDFHYFDDPEAFGYRGYNRRSPEDDQRRPWELALDECCRRRVKSALDIGCAKGFLVSEPINRGIRAEGFDVSLYALSFARSLPCLQRDVRDGIGRDVDVIIALGVLMYIREHQLARVLPEIRNSCRILIASNFYEGDKQVTPDKLRIITRPKAWWRELISGAGFKLDSQTLYFDVFV